MNDILGEDFPFSENILDGETALVCGASRGIGRSTALLLAKAGARVIACAQNQDLLTVWFQRCMALGMKLWF